MVFMETFIRLVVHDLLTTGSNEETLTRVTLTLVTLTLVTLTLVTLTRVNLKLMKANLENFVSRYYMYNNIFSYLKYSTTQWCVIRWTMIKCLLVNVNKINYRF